VVATTTVATGPWVAPGYRGPYVGVPGRGGVAATTTTTAVRVSNPPGPRGPSVAAGRTTTTRAVGHEDGRLTEPLEGHWRWGLG
jgi:hypothetical protein